MYGQLRHGDVSQRVFALDVNRLLVLLCGGLTETQGLLAAEIIVGCVCNSLVMWFGSTQVATVHDLHEGAWSEPDQCSGPRCTVTGHNANV